MSTQYGTNETDIKSSPQDDQQVANIPNSDLPPKEREKWGKKVDFLLSVIGFAVDLANVWRFPHYCFKNGGGAFLVPYVIMLIIGGIPLFFMELSLGQYHRKGAITCWGRIVPLLKGVGYSTVLIALYVDFYYNVIIAWCLYFFFASWTSELPWTNCNNKWNTDQCRELYKLAQHISSNSSNISISYNTNFTTTRLDYLGMTLHNITSPEAGNEYLGNNTLISDNFGSSINYDSSEAVLSVANRTSPAEEYFYRSLLQLSYSSGINDLGIVRWEVALCLLAVYLICYFSMWKGISTSGKVVWFTAVFPYVVLLIMLFWSVTLPGAAKGIEYYLTPRFDNLKNIRVWVEAAAQVFFSLGPGFGVLLAYASYNEFHNNVYRDAIATSAINCLTSFLAGFVIFSVLGYMAEQANTEVSEVTNEGMGLVFVVYPEAISTMPGATFWAVIFFLMLVTLGLDSSFGGSEAIVTALTDEFPIIGRNREKFMAILFSFYYLIGIISCTQGGAYLVHLFDTFAANYSILIAVVTEAIAISWIYGINRFCDDIKEMLGFQVSIYWKICLSRVTPIVLMFIIVYGLYRESPPEYRGKAYPLWANILGWGMTLSSVLCIPGMALYKLIKTPGTLKERLKRLTTPWRDLPTVNNGVSTSLNTVQINLKHENAKDV